MFVRQLRDYPETEDDVLGLEVEVEAEAPLGACRGWAQVSDGSLRGPYNVEYVLRSPKNLESSLKLIQKLRETLEPSKVIDSIRAGVHVHVNVKDLTMEQLLSYAMFYYILEEALVGYCGSNRVGNHFCLRMKDAEGHITNLANFFNKGNLRHLYPLEQMKYASCNFYALVVHGTLEFRSLQTHPNLVKMDEWVCLLYHLKQEAKKVGQPESIIENFSMDGGIAWCETLLGEHFSMIKDQPDLEIKLKDGMRVAQDLLIFSRS